MAKVKALVSFAGAVSMSANQVGEITDYAILSDLLRAGYVEELESEKVEAPKADTAKKRETKNESKRGYS